VRRYLLVALLVLGAACTKDKVENAPVPRDETTTSTTSAATTSTAAFVGALTPVSTPPGGSQVVVSAVRVGAHGSFDRVVFDFASGVPGYSVKYVDKPIIADASGDEVAVAGSAAIEVRLESALAHDLGQRTAGVGVVKEVVKSGDFEAVVHFAIGVASKLPFHVSKTGNQLIVDIGHG
jgi:hypothetical protein